MTQARTRFRTFEEYAALDPSELPEGHYEVVDGVLIEMGAENDQNLEIAALLFSILLQFVPYYLIRKGTEIAVASRSVTSRFPDLMVLTEDTRAAMKQNQRSLISPAMPPPCLVVEVVSPGEPGSQNYQRDYIDKPKEYAGRGIPEFWLIDPTREVVLVLSLVGCAYKTATFRGDEPIQSPTFKDLQLTANQIFAAGKEEKRSP